MSALKCRKGLHSPYICFSLPYCVSSFPINISISCLHFCHAGLEVGPSISPWRSISVCVFSSVIILSNMSALLRWLHFFLLSFHPQISFFSSIFFHSCICSWPLPFSLLPYHPPVSVLPLPPLGHT